MVGFIALVLALIGSIAAPVWLISQAQRHHAPTALVTAGAIDLLCGLLTVGFISIHLVSVIGQAASGRGFGGEAVFAYDFRFYSLILLGVVVLIPGLVCVMNARRLTEGDPKAWFRVLWASSALVLINFPLMPLQANAIGPGVTAAATLIALLASRKQFVPVAK